MTLVGELALWVALLMAAWGAIVSFAGGRTRRPELVASGERALYATFACLVLATAGLLVALVSSDFAFAYVASFTTANLPVGYKIVALWAGRAGLLLLWTLILSTCAAIAVARKETHTRVLMPYVMGTVSIGLLFSIAVLCFGTNPYERMALIPAEGQGMAPELLHPAMAIHAPSLSIGYAAATIPVAFAITALLGRVGGWTHTAQRWLTISWFFLTLGIITGMWWAYVEPARHESWPWYAIRSWAVVPWLGVAMAGAVVAVRQRELRLTARRAALGRQRVRKGAYVVGTGAMVVAVALAAISFSIERDLTLQSGESATLVDPYRRAWTFTSQGLSDFPEHNRAVEAVALRAARERSPHKIITSERRQYFDSRGRPTFAPSIRAGIDYSVLQDTYVVLTNVVDDRVDLRISFHPLRIWVWIGGITVAIGGSMLMWPAADVRQRHG